MTSGRQWSALSSLLASKPDNRLLPDLEPELRVGLSRAEQNLRLKAVIDNLVATNGREVSQRDGSVPMSQGISSDLPWAPDPGALDNWISVLAACFSRCDHGATGLA